MHPNLFSDVNGEYAGFDGKPHRIDRHRQKAQYGTFSGWDVYRGQLQLVTLLRPDVGGDIAQVLLLTSLVAALLSFHNVLARDLFSLGDGSALPAACGRSHPRHASPHVASLVQSSTAAAFLVLFAVTGLDPVVQVFAWMAGTATLGILALMALTCAAVLVFFRRTRVDARPWQTLVAPGLALLGLLAFLLLTVLNFPTLIGGSTALAVAIGAVLVAFFVGGALWARRLAATAPPARAAAETP